MATIRFSSSTSNLQISPPKVRQPCTIVRTISCVQDTKILRILENHLFLGVYHDVSPILFTGNSKSNWFAVVFIL